MIHYIRILIGLFLLATLTGCAMSQKKPDEYRVIHESVLRSDMRTMAASLGKLADLYFDTTVSEAELHQAVHKELDNIKNIASNIRSGREITNYSVINRYMGAFLYDVDLAKQFADRDPPNYVPANRLLNSCMSCHSSFEI